MSDDLDAIMRENMPQGKIARPADFAAAVAAGIESRVRNGQAVSVSALWRAVHESGEAAIQHVIRNVMAGP